MGNSSILRVFEDRNYVWDVGAQNWVPMQQPILNAGSVSVIGTVANPLYTTALEFDASNNPIYIGTATQGSAKSAASWQIRKLTFDGSNNVTDIKFASGAATFTFIWDNRAAYAYS